MLDARWPLRPPAPASRTALREGHHVQSRRRVVGRLPASPWAVRRARSVVRLSRARFVVRSAALPGPSSGSARHRHGCPQVPEGAQRL